MSYHRTGAQEHERSARERDRQDDRRDGSAGRGRRRGCATSGGAIGAPDFILPWLDRFYDEDDVDLVLAAAAGDVAGAAPARLERACRRAVLDRDEAGAYAPADLHERLEFWAMFEGWKDVPLAVHRRLADWDADHYAERIRAGVEAVRDGREGDQGDYTYVLLHEAEAILHAQEHIYLWPCDCRAIVSKCRKPMDVCLRFDNDRGRRLGDLRRARRQGAARDRQGRADAHRRLRRRPCDLRRHLQLLHRLLLPPPGHGAAGDGRRVAGAPARRLHRPRRLQEVRPLRAALPVRRDRRAPRRAAGPDAGEVPRLRPLPDRLQRRRHRAAPAGDP